MGGRDLSEVQNVERNTRVTGIVARLIATVALVTATVAMATGYPPQGWSIID